ncbi:hypothetical protein G195_011413 [Phytophthora kernoviae 00238/432]|uniref:RxLR effector protein n=1 Tax=Phytophthora kernoviae 00238/432 TaxID=1284355 RepID=A0A8J4RQL5_9STRA|nr:hypothetical protein G195_011413 [Phytophthora kernoviae 00238/432]
MRLYSILLLTLALLSVASNTALADTPATAYSLTAVNNEGNSKRSLRAIETAEDGDDDDDGDEERLPNLGQLSEKLQLSKMRHSARKEMKAADKIKAAESAAAKKLAIQEKKKQRLIDGWLAEMKDPDDVYKVLGLKKLGPKAEESINYPFYQKYKELHYFKSPNIHVRYSAFIDNHALQREHS